MVSISPMKTTPQGPPAPDPDEHHPSDESPADGSHTSVNELRQHEQRRLWGGVVIGLTAPLLVAFGLLALGYQATLFPLNEEPPRDFGAWITSLQCAMPEELSIGGIALALMAVGLTLFLATAVTRTRADTPHEAARQDVLDTLTAAVTAVGAVLSWLLVPLPSWRQTLPVVDVGAALWCACLNGALFGLTRQDAHKVSRWIEETQDHIGELDALARQYLPKVRGRPADGTLPEDWAVRDTAWRRWWRNRWEGFPWLGCVFGGAVATFAAFLGVFPNLLGVAVLFVLFTVWQSWWVHSLAMFVAGSIRDKWGRWIWLVLPGLVVLSVLAVLTAGTTFGDPPFTWLPRSLALACAVLVAPVLAVAGARSASRPAPRVHPWLSPLIVTKIRNEQVLALRQFQSQRLMWHARQPGRQRDSATTDDSVHRPGGQSPRPE